MASVANTFSSALVAFLDHAFVSDVKSAAAPAAAAAAAGATFFRRFTGGLGDGLGDVGIFGAKMLAFWFAWMRQDKSHNKNDDNHNKR